jgi:chromosome segregation ATPase
MLELLLALLKQLAVTLTPSEFLTASFLIAGAVFFVVRFILKNAKCSGGLLSIFTGNRDAKIEELSSKIAGTVSKEELTRVENRIIAILEEMKREAREHSGDLNQQVQVISIIRVEIQNSFAQINKQMDDIQQQMKRHDLHDEAQFAAIKESVAKNQELVNRVLSQVDKVDEFVRTTVPEFRSYHKELTKEVHNLSRDISVMDRVLQAQINTSKEGITLR